MSVLVSWLWQGVLIAGLAAILVRIRPRLNAATRYGLWWTALLLVAALPIVWPALAWLRSAIEPAGGWVPLVDSTAAGTGWSFALPEPSVRLIAAGCLAWIVFVVWRMVQILRSMSATMRLKRASHPLEAARQAGWPLWDATRRASRRCELRVSDRVAGPCVAGLRRPAILLPPGLLHALSDAEIDQVILHEHAHVVRYDDWSRLAQCLLTAVIGVHPATWLINRQIDLEREAACDDRVIARTREPRAYAACLARVAAARCAARAREPLIVPAAMRSRRILRTRVLRLLDRDVPAVVRLGWTPVALGLTALGAAALAAGLVLPPPITFVARATTVLDALPAVAMHWRATLPSAPAATVLLSSLDPLPARPLDAQPIDPDPVDSQPIAAQSSALPSASTWSLPHASAFATFGTRAAHTGTALGTHLGAMGEHLGGWFAQVARHASTP